MTKGNNIMKKRKYDLTKFQRIYLTTFKIVYSAIILAAALWITIPDGPYCILIGAIGLIILIFTFDERKATHTYSTYKRPLLVVKPEPILLVKNEFEEPEQYSVYENNKNSDSNGNDDPNSNETDDFNSETDDYDSEIDDYNSEDDCFYTETEDRNSIKIDDNIYHISSEYDDESYFSE